MPPRTYAALAAALVATVTGCATTRDGATAPTTRVVKAGVWRLGTSQDPFAGTISCRLRSSDRRIAVEAGAVAFRFGSRMNVVGAVYRVDGGAPREWRDDLPRLVRAGVPLDRGSMANPTAGRVWIPLSRLTDARAVGIRPAPKRKVRTFRLAGIQAALEAAAARGCPQPESFGQW